MIRSGSITVVDLTDIDTIENWYLATDQSSGVTRNTEGWTTTVQMMDSSHPYLWTYEITKGSGNVVINTTEPVIIGRYGTDGSGTDGRGIVQIDDYYAINNSTTEPVDGEFTTTVVNPTPINKYLWNYEVTTYTDSTTESTEKRIIGVYGDKPVITSNPKQDGVTTILADGTAIATIADGTDGHSPTITTSKAAGSTTTKILADGVEIGSVEDGNDGHSPVVTASKSDGITTIQVDGNIVSTINDGNSVRISSATKQDGVTTIVLTDESGSQTLTIVDGEDGSDGQPGRDGANSYLHIAWANDTSGTDFSTSDSTNKLYMGTYSDSTIADSTDYRKYNWSKIKGEQGATGAQGTSVVKTEIEYYMKVQGGAAPDSSTTGSTIIPNYEPGSTYYKRTVTYLSDNTSFKGNWIQDTGLTNEIKNAHDAWVAAGTAEQRTKKIITDSNGVTVAAGVNGADVTEGTTSTYGYNTIMAPNYLGLRYNDINLSKLTTTGLDFYIPTMNGTTPVQGNKGLELTSNAITFYNPNTDQAQLIIGANGTLQSGNYARGSDSKFSGNGTKIDLINGDIITRYFRVSQGLETGLNAGVYVHGTIEALDGTIGTDSTNYWEIGNDTDYNLNSTAKMIGHGSSYIQLGDSSTWRLATNRIHTGWHVESDKLLHFPKFTDGTNTLYWDYGLHSPTEKSDKFLYIRTASGTAQLSNLLYDIDDSYATPQWTYKFYIDGDGNLTTTGSIDAHNISIDGVSIAGGSLIAGSLSSYGGSSNRPVYFPSSGDNKGKPVQIAVTDNDSATAVSHTDTNLITARTLYYAGYVKSSGITSVQITATSPVYSSTSTEQTGSSAVTTISLANGYGDTKNPYGNKTKNYVLAAPSNGNGVPSFRSLVASDIPDLSDIYLTSYTETDPVFNASVAHGITRADINNWNSKTTNTGTVESVRIQATSPVTSSVDTAQSTTLNTTIALADAYGDTKNPYGTKSANYVLAGPGSGSAAIPSFRKLIAADIPDLSWSKITSGKPDTTSGYGITDALVGVEAKSVSGGSTTFTFTKSNGDILPVEVVVYASAATQATDANYLTNGTTRYTVGGAKQPIYFEGGIPKASNGTEGTSTKPVYLNNGTITAGSTYAGGTKVTLNYSDKGASTASFYAPVEGGTTSQILVGGGTNSAPTWKAISDIVPSKASTADAFSSAATVALTGDTTGSASSTKGWSIATTTARLSGLGRRTTAATIALNPLVDTGFKMSWHISDGSSRTADAASSPSFDAAVINLPWDWGAFNGQIALANTTTTPRMQIRSASHTDNGESASPRYTPIYSAWREVVTATRATQIGSATQPVYVSNTGQITAGTALGGAAYHADDYFVKRAGDTMTGVLNALANQYTDGYTGALNMNNSNIYGVNSIYTADLSDNSQEGIHFYRTSTTVDTIYAQNGNLYFVPNRTIGTNGTSYTVLHTGNYTSTLNNKYVTLDTTQTITAQKTFNTGTRWSVTDSASGSKYGAVNYDANLDALVFSFGTI